MKNAIEEVRVHVEPDVDPRFARAQGGCQESLNALMRAHDGLVQAAVRRQVTGDAPFAELLQAGRIGLWQALLKYDPQRGGRFATYAWPCIVHAIWRAARATPPCPDLTLEPAPAVNDPAEVYVAREVRAELYHVVAQLPERLRTVVVQRYGLEGHPPATFGQIGAQWGLTGERARQLHVEALLWLQHPGHAAPLHSLLGRHTVEDYAAGATRRAQWRARGRRRDG